MGRRRRPLMETPGDGFEFFFKGPVNVRGDIRRTFLIFISLLKISKDWRKMIIITIGAFIHFEAGGAAAACEGVHHGISIEG